MHTIHIEANVHRCCSDTQVSVFCFFFLLLYTSPPDRNLDQPLILFGVRGCGTHAVSGGVQHQHLCESLITHNSLLCVHPRRRTSLQNYNSSSGRRRGRGAKNAPCLICGELRLNSVVARFGCAFCEQDGWRFGPPLHVI